MQFLSQAVSWADSIILAMAPLGIITIIVAAIRVGGPPWLKATIGRAKESVADAESELMSSTSTEVCELWDDRQIVRVTGKAPIHEFIILVPEENHDSRKSNTPDTPTQTATGGLTNENNQPVGSQDAVQDMGEEALFLELEDPRRKEYLANYGQLVPPSFLATA